MAQLSSEQINEIKRWGGESAAIAAQTVDQPLQDAAVTCSVCLVPYYTTCGDSGTREQPARMACGHIIGEKCGLEVNKISISPEPTRRYLI